MNYEKNRLQAGRRTASEAIGGKVGLEAEVITKNVKSRG